MNQKSKIKVLALINSLAPAGAERLLLQIAEHIDKDKFDFVVCYLEKEKSLLDEFKKLRIKTIGLEINHKLDMRVIRRLYKTLKSEKPDILHTHLPYAGIIGRIIGRLAKVPVIISTQHNVASSFKKILLLFEKLTFPLANVITCVSEGVEQSFFDQSNVFSMEVLRNNYKHFTIYNGVDVEKIEKIVERTDFITKRKELGLNENDKVITIVARLIKWKGHLDLISAFSKVAEYFSSAKLLIVGWGDLEPEIKKKTKELNLEKKVVFLGKRNDVYEILKISDIFVLPYNYIGLFKGEGVGIAILEAMACKKPVITTIAPGIERAIINEKTGILVPQGDPKALAEAIINLLEDPDKLKKIGEEGFVLVKNKFSVRNKTKEYEKVYEYLFKLNKIHENSIL
jgi:glycosyltransferase involved in cell wall biosynthesis